MLENSFAKYRKNIQNAVPASICIPYLRHVDERTMKTKKGDYIRIYEVTGVQFQTLSQDEIDAWSLTKERLLKGIQHPRFAIWTNLVHERYSNRLAANYNNGFSQALFDQYNANVLKNIFINRYFISVVLLGNTGMNAFRDSIDKDGGGYEQNENLKLLDTKCADIEKDFQHAGIKPLLLIERDGRLFSNAASLIGRLYNGYWDEQPVTRNDLCETIPSVATLFSKEVVEQRGIVDAHYGALLTVKDYDEHTNVNQFNDLLSLPFEFILSQSFTFIPQGKAIEMVNVFVDEMLAANDKSESQYGQLAYLQDLLASGNVCMGKFHMTLHSADTDINTAANNLNSASSILRQGGIISQRAYLDAEPCFLAQMPGNHAEITYNAPITNVNFSHFNAFHTFPTGKQYGNHWGDAVCQLKSAAGTPYYFNFHVEDVGHTALYGTTGAGKTLLENFLLSMCQKYNPRINIFDSKRNSEPFIKALHGCYFNLELNQPSGFAPLQMDPTPINIEFCKDLLKILVTTVEKAFNIEDMNKISAAVNSVMSTRVPLEKRTLSALLQFLPNVGENNLHDRLLMWTRGYQYGWIFDNDEDKLSLANKNNGFNTDNILALPQAKTPIMAYLWHRIDNNKDGRPMINVFDEAWSLLDGDYFESKLKAGLKKDRKENTLNIMTTQSPSDAVNSSIHETILEQTATTIMLSNPKGDWDTYKKLDATHEEFMLVKRSTKESRRFVLKQEQDSIVIDFNLSGISDYLPILSASKYLLPVFDRCVKEHGEKWLPHYIEGAKHV